jgi:hypothetical protein
MAHERFYRAWANRRRNPFTKTENPVIKQENGLVIPTSSPYLVQLVETPLKEIPSSVTVYNVTDNQYMTEVQTAPGQGQFRVDYPEPDGEGTGLVEFSSLDAGKEVNVTYKGTGSPVVTEFLEAMMEGFDNAVLGTAASFTVKHSNDDEKTTTSTAPAKLKETKINKSYPGSVRVIWRMACEQGGGVWAQVYKNGTPLGSEQGTDSQNWRQFTQDITDGLQEGDLIQIYVRAASGDTGHIKNMKLGFDWYIISFKNWILSSPLALTNTDPLDATNQDP